MTSTNDLGSFAVKPLDNKRASHPRFAIEFHQKAEAKNLNVSRLDSVNSRMCSPCSNVSNAKAEKELKQGLISRPFEAKSSSRN